MSKIDKVNQERIERTKPYRFPMNRQNHTQKGPYLTPLLKKFLEKKIKYEDPETQKIIFGKVKDAILWRLILNASQGENEAIKEILNRIDGKLSEIQIDQSQHTQYVIFRNPAAIREETKDPNIPSR